MSIEAMKQALEVLENFVDDPRAQHQIDAASAVLRQAIADVEKQEPVAWIEHHKGGDNLVWDEPNKGTPLYTISQSKREPVAWDNCRAEKQCRIWCGNFDCVSHYTQPQPKCEWVGLTVMEAVELELATNHPREFAAAIEAKLKEKNT